MGYCVRPHWSVARLRARYAVLPGSNDDVRPRGRLSIATLAAPGRAGGAQRSDPCRPLDGVYFFGAPQRSVWSKANPVTPRSPLPVVSMESCEGAVRGEL